jgi:RND superfamily putative drug exporter
MALLGERNWYLPRWLQWLPSGGHEDASVDLQRPVEREPALATPPS